MIEEEREQIARKSKGNYRSSTRRGRRRDEVHCVGGDSSGRLDGDFPGLRDRKACRVTSISKHVLRSCVASSTKLWNEAEKWCLDVKFLFGVNEIQGRAALDVTSSH